MLGSDHGQNSVVELAIEGSETLTVMVRDYAYHPITRELVHADFVQVKLDQPVEVEVPFRCTGKSKGVVGGGILQQIFRRIPVRSLPSKIPSVIARNSSTASSSASAFRSGTSRRSLTALDTVLSIPQINCWISARSAGLPCSTALTAKCWSSSGTLR